MGGRLSEELTLSLASYRAVEETPWRNLLINTSIGSAKHIELQRPAELHPAIVCMWDGPVGTDAQAASLHRIGERVSQEGRWAWGASGFHTFRHSAASIVNERTGNLKLAQKFLGHSTIKMAADIYTHTSAEAERDAAIALERAIYGDLFPVVPNIENRNNSPALN